MWRTRLALGCALAVSAVALAAAPAHAGDPLAELKAGCAARTSTDQRPVRYRICSAKIPSFDGTRLDATLTLPAKPPRKRKLPLLVMLHGLFNSKNEYLSETRTGTGADRGGEAYKTIGWNNVWFASRGYAVLTYSARAHGDSEGELGLAHRDIEVRDTHHLTGLLVDDLYGSKRPLARIDRRRVGVFGGSYGGGQAWLLLTTRGSGANQYGTWRSPRGKLVKLAAAVPAFTWTDLLHTLAPNGRQRSDAVVDPATADIPFGVGKATLVDGFIATGGNKLTPELLRYLARFNAGEPYDDPSDPVVPEARRALTEDRSAYFQNGFFDALAARRQRRVPVLAAQGWTDPIFHAIEPVRMYRRLRAASPGYPIALYLGDFEHLTSLNKQADFQRWHALGNRLLDRYLRGARKRVRFDAETALTDCDPKRFGPLVRAADWDRLAPRRARFDLGGPQQTASPLQDQRATSTDPVVVSVQPGGGRGCIRTTLGPTPGVAAYRVRLDRELTLIGMPRVTLRFRSLAPDLELNSRLWDVAPDGTQTLVSRGAYRVVDPSPGGERVEYELFGNAWRFAAGHELLLEVTQDDSTYFRRDNVASSATIDDATLVLPTR